MILPQTSEDYSQTFNRPIHAVKYLYRVHYLCLLYAGDMVRTECYYYAKKHGLNLCPVYESHPCAELISHDKQGSISWG